MFSHVLHLASCTFAELVDSARKGRVRFRVGFSIPWSFASTYVWNDFNGRKNSSDPLETLRTTKCMEKNLLKPLDSPSKWHIMWNIYKTFIKTKRQNSSRVFKICEKTLKNAKGALIWEAHLVNRSPELGADSQDISNHFRPANLRIQTKQTKP